MTLNDLERRNSFYFAFFHQIWQIFRPFISQWLKIDLQLYNVCKILSPSSSLLLLAKTITHPAARFLCDIAEHLVLLQFKYFMTDVGLLDVMLLFAWFDMMCVRVSQCACKTYSYFDFGVVRACYVIDTNLISLVFNVWLMFRVLLMATRTSCIVHICMSVIEYVCCYPRIGCEHLCHQSIFSLSPYDT